jgi:hypothetical protein
MSQALANGINYCIPCRPLQFAATTTIAAGPTPITAAQTYFRKATILAKKAVAGTANSGNIQLGPSATASEQPYTLAPDDEITLEPPLGAKWDFTDWYITVANDNDGVVVIYS